MQKSLFVVVFFAFCGVSLQTSSANETGEDIFGGSPAAPGQYPFFVSLVQGGYWHNCGASLISDRHVLTAAHCIWPPESPYRFAYQAENAFRQQYSVRLGTNLNSGGTVYRISGVKIYPYFNRVNLANDVAVIALSAAVRYTNLIKPVRLLRSRVGPQSGVVIGLGYLRFDPRTRPPSSLSPTTLQHLSVTIDSDYTCQTSLFPVHMRSSTACIKGDRAGPLPGDSGSPLLVQRGGGEWWQAGICSFGDYMAYMNAINGRVFSPTGYVRVANYCPFIAQMTRNMAYCQ